MITLKTLKDATAQEVFNQVASHMLRQNEVSKHANGIGCAYRGVNGLMCAAGCLISDEEYLPEMDEPKQCGYAMGWVDLHRFGYVTGEHEDMINRLQIVHDLSKTEYWKNALRDIADDLKLEFDPEKLTNKSCE